MTNPSSPDARQILKSIVLSAFALSIGYGITYGLTLLRKPPVLREPVERVYNVEVFAVESLDLREIVRAFGTSQADREVVLSAQVAGEVTEIHPHLKVGQAIRAKNVSSDESVTFPGDLLVHIDPTTYEARMEQGRAQLAEDRAELKRIQQEEANLERLHKTIAADFEDSKREYEKSQLLRKQGINTDSDLRRAQMDLRQHEKGMDQNRNDLDLLPVRRELIQRRIESHEANLKVAEIELARTSVRSPFDGIVSAVQVEVGQYVRVGEPLATITEQRIVEVPLSVTLDDYAKLLPDVLERRYPPVELAENEGAAARWHGRVMRVSPKADEQTRTAMVFVHIDNTEQQSPLLPGTFVQARIDGPILKRAVLVPRDAVLEEMAFVERDGVIQQRRVRIARTLHNLALIESGLEPGELIALTNLDVLFDGARVRPSQIRTLEEELGRQRSPSARLIRPTSAANSTEE
ncbi:MAG: efflux RND transporter periplasmic adaptor subunit [Planctomycetes bacterium]|nr:efflux RND transporter periplasmic adaptor subunit [Planctomycetota bacterium]